MLTSCAPALAELAGQAGTDLPDPISLLCLDDLPCRVQDPDLWFAESPADLEVAKSFCRDCPARLACLSGAIERQPI